MPLARFNPLTKVPAMKILFHLITAIALPLAAQESGKPTPERFEIDGHVAVVYHAPRPAEGKPWLWYAPTLKGGLSLAGRKVYFDAFMNAGISVAGFDLGEVRGAPGSTAKFTLFHHEMVKRGFSPKPILLGQSRGGMMTLAWAVRNPDKVKAWVGIYPVCNLASWPLKNSKKETLADFGLTEDEIRGRIDEFNPIANLEGLARNRVPMFAEHGDSDVVVPYDDNTWLLKEHYEALGGSFTERVIAGEGHKATASFFENAALIDFVIEQGR